MGNEIHKKRIVYENQNSIFWLINFLAEL